MELTSQTSLRILLISTEEIVRDSVGQVLQTGFPECQLSWVSQPDLGIFRAEQLLPHVILVDDKLGGTSAAALIRRLNERVPHSTVLFLVDEGAMSEASQAVLAGARGFVSKPLGAEELQASLRQVLSQQSTSDTESGSSYDAGGHVIVFCAPKGGTGRTTLAINTAVGLQMAAKNPVALVDADYAAPAIDVALNLPAGRTIEDLLPRLATLDRDLISGVLAHHTSGIRALLAPAPSVFSGSISMPQAQQILVVLKHMFSWVVVDLGLPLDETAFAFLDSADHIVMSVLPEMVGLRNARLMLNALYHHGYAEDKVWLVVNRATMASGISRADIEEHLRVHVRFSIPDDQPLATSSINRGVPIVMTSHRSALARSFRKFTSLLQEDFPASLNASGQGAPVTWPVEGTATQNVLNTLRVQSEERPG